MERSRLNWTEQRAVVFRLHTGRRPKISFEKKGRKIIPNYLLGQGLSRHTVPHRQGQASENRARETGGEQI